MKDDECENADYGDRRERIDQEDRCRYDPNQPEHYTHPAKALAKGRGPEHRHTEGDETYRPEEESYGVQLIEYALGRLPQEDECRLILEGRPRSMIEVGDWGGGDMRESPGREHDEAQNAQDTPEESGREARPLESTIQGEEVGDPQYERHQV